MTWMNRKFSDAFGLSLALVLATVLSSRLEAQSEAVSINPPMTFALNDLALSVLSERQGNRITNVNVVGYVDIDIPPGFSMIANHLTRRDNSVGELFPGVPEGTTIYKFDPVSQSFSANEFAAGAWTNPDETLLPGEGAFIKNPTTNTLRWTIVGEVLQGTSTNDIPAGLSIRSFVLPMGIPLEAMGFPAELGDTVFRFDPVTQQYTSHVNIYGEWLPPCKLTVGEAFFVLRAKAAFWVHTFNISAPIIGP
ncbi:MAG: hypothetical protein AAB466_13775 [Verrucomicrobiota bacterium]